MTHPVPKQDVRVGLTPTVGPGAFPIGTPSPNEKRIR